MYLVYYPYIPWSIQWFSPSLFKMFWNFIKPIEFQVFAFMIFSSPLFLHRFSIQAVGIDGNQYSLRLFLIPFTVIFLLINTQSKLLNSWRDQHLVSLIMSFGWSLLSFRVTSSTKMGISDSLPIFSYLIKLYWEFTSFFHKKQRQILDLRRQSGIVPETATLPIFSIYFIILFL